MTSQAMVKLADELNEAFPRLAAAPAAARFVMWAMMEGCWQGCDIDGGAAQDKAVELGLIVETTYDPAIHGEGHGLEPGDVWYVPSAELLAALTAPPLPADGVRDILAERQRQITEEGWTHEHDDAHDKGEMAHAAGSYALADHDRVLWIGGNEFPLTWPWHKRWWKPKDRRSNLIRAGALIVAEIERLDRAALASPHEQGEG